MPDSQKTQAIEEAVSGLYGRLWEELNTIQSPEIISQFLYNVSLPKDWFRNKTCLDAGCGSGFATWVMRQLGAKCYACDLDSKTLERVSEKLADPDVQLLAASVLELPYASDNFDFVHCNGVLHHTVNARRGFTELARVTRPGGTLFISVYGRGGLYNAMVGLGRTAAHVIPYRWADAAATIVFRDRTIPNSFMPAKVSALDNLYVPVREAFLEREIRGWFTEEGIEEVVRTKNTIYDHDKPLNRFIHGEGYLQLRGRKPPI